MVELATVPDRIVTTTAPTSAVSRGEIESSGDRMANALGKVAGATMDIAAQQARDQAGSDLQQQKVVRNPDGSVGVATPANSLIFGRAGEVYNEAVKAGTIAQHSNVISQQLTELHQKYPTDPQGFRVASEAFKASYVQQHGGATGEGIEQHFEAQQTQHLNSITNTSGNIDITNQQKSIQATIADQKNTLQGLARQPGGTDTPEFKKSLARMTASYQALGSNPLFRMPQDQIDLEIKNFRNLLQGEALVSHIDDTFTKKGKGDAQKVLNEGILQNPNLSEMDRNRLFSHGMARLQYLTSDAKELIQAGKEDINLLKTNIAGDKIKPTDPIVGMGMAQALNRGDGAGAHEIYAAQLVAQQRRGLDTLPLEIQAQALGVNRTGAVNQSIPAEGRALLDHIAGPESGGRYDVIYSGRRFGNFADHPRISEPITSGPDVGQTSSAAGRYQFLGSTWDEQAKKLGLKNFSPENQDAAAWNLAQEEYKRKTGNDLLSVLRSGNQAAISEVPRQLSGQWASLPGGRQPAGPGGRAIAQAANGGPGFTWEQVQRNPYLISAYVRDVAKDETAAVESTQLLIGGINKAIDNGIAPSAPDIAMAMQQAEQHPEKLGPAVAAMEGRLSSEIISKLPRDQRDAFTAQYKELMNGQDQYHMRVADAFLAQQKQSEKRMADDPYSEAAHRGWIAPVSPINPAQTESIPGALAERAAASQRIASLNNTPAPPVLTKGEIPQLQSALEGPQGAQALASIATSLKPAEMERLLGEKGFVDTVTAMQSSLDPAKMSTANAVVDKIFQQNAARAEQALGKPSIDKMQAWQALKGSFAPEELAKTLNQSDDPATAKARDQATKAADVEIKKLTPSDMAYKMGTGTWLFGGLTGNTPKVPTDALVGSALVNDYGATYSKLRSLGVPADKASDAAVKRLGASWGPSEAAGNQLMRLPPEHYYRPIEGAPNWIGEQLNDFVTASQGPAMRQHPAVPGKGSSPRTSWSVSGLVSDSQTEGEISSGQLPSYHVAIQRGNGDIDVLPDRVRFDQGKYMAKHEKSLRTQLSANQEVMSGLAGPQP